MLGDGKTIGHPGDEVADPPRPLGLSLAASARGRQPFRRQIGRAVLVAREQIEQDLFGIPHHPHHRGCRYI